MQHDTICVIGVSGYIGSHVAAALLQRGYSVHGTLRNPTGPHLGWLKRELMPLAHEGRALTLHAAELLDPDSLQRAMDGCSGVIMCAGVESQVPETITLMVAAANHTLDAAEALGITRAVFTSSTGSTNPPGGDPTLKNEIDHWSDDEAQIAAGKFSPAAKTRMERTALARSESGPVRVAILNPSLILGPAFQDTPPSALKFIRAILKGERMAERAPNGSMSIIDVRDLAALHVAALENPDARGRYFGVKRSWHWQDILDALHRVHPTYTPPAWPAEIERVRPTAFDLSRQRTLGVDVRDLDDILTGVLDELAKRAML